MNCRWTLVVSVVSAVGLMRAVEARFINLICRLHDAQEGGITQRALTTWYMCVGRNSLALAGEQRSEVAWVGPSLSGRRRDVRGLGVPLDIHSLASCSALAQGHHILASCLRRRPLPIQCPHVSL